MISRLLLRETFRISQNLNSFPIGKDNKLHKVKKKIEIIKFNQSLDRVDSNLHLQDHKINSVLHHMSSQ